MKWRSGKREMMTWVLSITAATLLVSWILRAAYVVLWRRRPLDLPLGFNPDEACRRVGTSCGTLTGFVVSWLSIGAAMAIFLLLRLWAVIRPYRSRAVKTPSELVPTAGTIPGDIVGRDEICEVMIDDLRNSADRRPHILLGGVGTGKTAVMVQLTHLLAMRGAVPVPIRLRDAEKGVLDFQGLAWKQFRAEIEPSILSQGEGERAWRYLRKHDRIVVLADGMEEALSDDGSGDDREAMVRVGIRRARRDRLPLVIASRPHDTLRGADAAIFELEPLSKSDSLGYLERRDAAGDRQRLDWIVETADIAESPIYLRITRELHDRGLLQHLTDGVRAHGVNTRDLDRSALRLNLLDTWLWALVHGRLQPGVPLNQDERLLTVTFASVMAIEGLKRDSLEVRYSDVVRVKPGREDGEREISAEDRQNEDDDAGEHLVDEALRARVTAVLKARRIRPVQIRLAATWASRLGLLEARGEEVRFDHSILQAYLGSLLLDEVIGNDAFRTEAFQAPRRPGRELLIAAVLMSRRRVGSDLAARRFSADNPITGATAVAPDRLHAVVTALTKRASSRKDNKSLDMFAAALEIDSVVDLPQHPQIAARVRGAWDAFTASDQRTLEEAKIGLVRRFGDAARQIDRRAARREQPGTVAPGYHDLFRIGCLESASYAVRHAVAQELGVSGHGAFDQLKEDFAAALDDDCGDVNDPEEWWRTRIMSAWLAPLLFGSVGPSGPGGPSAQDDAERNLREWVRRVGATPVGDREPRLPISVEVALAQGFTYSANRRRRHPYSETGARSFLVEQAADLLKRTGFWAGQLPLLHALTLWSLPDDGVDGADPPPPSRRDGPRTWSTDPSTRVQHWLQSAGTKRDRTADADRGSTVDRKHPFVREAAELAVLALDSREPERFIWIDVFGVTSKIGSRNKHLAGPRKHNLWIPPSTGWSSLAPRAQQLVADVLLLINLADRGPRSVERETRLERANRPDLPPCFAREREPLDPNRAAGDASTMQPGSNCAGGCPFELCPYPPKGIQSYRAEMSEAFCRRQQTLLGRSRLRRRAAPWQGTLPEDLGRFWAEMAHRARR
ncbi:hypothetical protein SAMN05661080_03613 [Modestobacter sp. DSM 44400]|uniref:ATP-binding protein n=1 Tax=Modestobacter sp. DSM 44400 TaxID=1550230 RepID=UPI00089D32C4|nr:ATP-binding protein [Modestobacter sp. DSM 44400]SDY48162.1 hypothetical protein SAMN05661080_03613 [Modestobacter sp. DSM 44400]